MLQFQDLTSEMLTPYIKNYILHQWWMSHQIFNNRGPTLQEIEVIIAYLSVANPSYVFINTKVYELWHWKSNP